MSTLSCTSMDVTTLPNELLAETKAHLRVEFDRDDDYIKSALSRAIGEFEQYTGINVFATVWAWVYEGDDIGACCYSIEEPTDGKVPVPTTPVISFTVVDNDDVDISDQYTLYNNSKHYPKQVLIKPAPLNYLTTLNAGYDTAADVPPSIKNAIFLLVGTLYEQREQMLFGTVNLLPDWAAKILTGMWQPRV